MESRFLFDINVDAEFWISIRSYPQYVISSFGRIKNMKTNRILEYGKISGYDSVTLSNGGTQKTFLVHRLVAQHFLKNPDNKPWIDHINGNKDNNHINNLRWCTASENNQNRANFKNKKSKYKGVSPIKNKWQVNICCNRCLIKIGCFENEDEAGRAYDAKAKELFGSFARLNFSE